MFYWALVFFVVALVAGVLGFGGISGTATGMAQILLYAGVILFVITLVAGGARRNRTLP